MDIDRHMKRETECLRGKSARLLHSCFHLGNELGSSWCYCYQKFVRDSLSRLVTRVAHNILNNNN